MFVNSFIAGLSFTLAAVFCFTLHFLLEPRTLGYPRAPGFLRKDYFMFALVLFFCGMNFLWASFAGANTIPPQAGPITILIGVSLMIHKGTMLFNVARQHYTPETWKRIHRVNDLARCNPNGCSLFRGRA